MLEFVDILSDYYKKNLYKKEDIAKFVASGKITAAQYLEIIGEEYVAPVINSVITDIQTDILKNTAASNFTIKLIDKKVDDLAVKVDGGAV